MTQPGSAEVRFRASFDAPAEQDRSRLIADFIAAPLATFRVRCDAPRYVDEGSAFGCVVGERRFELLVSEGDGPAGEWRISISSGLGWIRRRVRARDDDELLHLARVMHKVLADGAHIEGVTWHGVERLSARPDRAWWDEP